jgi:predicted metal-dependent hydrolase
MIQKDKVRYGTATISYEVIKSRRIKTSEIIVDANSVIFRTHFHKKMQDIQKIVLGKAEWILKTQREQREAISDIIKPKFKENSTLPYLGKNYPLRILSRQMTDSFDFVNGQFEARTVRTSINRKNLERLYYDWLTKTAYPIFKEKIHEVSSRIDIAKPVQINIKVKKLKNRWGSLTKRRVLNLNVNLLKAHEDVIYYIILHELCHSKIKEHSHHYWDLLHKFMPDYQEKIDWLKTNASNLI